MSIAQDVADACTDATAFTIYGGYAVHANGTRKLFSTGRQLAEKRNDKGRVTHAKYVYEDGSTLEYRYRGDTYRLVVG